MLARVAENLFWLSRYLERVENTVRLINVHGNLLMDLPSVDEHQGWMPLISINGQDKEFAEHHGSATELNVNDFLLAEKENSGSLLNAFKAIQVNLRSCRDILPKKSYESINSLCRLVVREVASSYQKPAQRHAFLRSVEERLQTISGSISSNMSHDLGYLMMRMGCYLERADMTSRIVDIQSTRLTAANSPRELMVIQAQRWVAVLRTLAAHQMYRQHVRRPVNGSDALAFILADPYLPRSYSFCLAHLDECLRKLPDHSQAIERLIALKTLLGSAEFDRLSREPDTLHEFLDDLQLGLLKVSAAISQSYFPPLLPEPEVTTGSATATASEPG